MCDHEQKSMQIEGVEQSTIVITGMHRSGTSLTTALCQNAGVDVGKRLMVPHESNPKGFYENLDFVDFHRKVLQSQGINEAGYTLQEKIDVEEHHRDEAKKIISENSQSQLWGWKDPRTTLFLDFWVDLLPNAFFLLVYRSPWEVIDSLYRRGTDRLILSHPDLAVKVWSNYNQKILEFSDKFPERCLLTNIYQITENTELFIDTINEKFNINLSVPSLEIYDLSLLHKKIANVSGATLVNHYCPEAIEIYRELELKTNRMDETGSESWEKEINSSLSRVNAFQNWLAVRNLEKENKRIQPQLNQTKTELEQTSAQLEQIESERQQTKTELEQTSAQLEQIESERQQTKTQLEQIESECQQTTTQLEQTSAQLEQIESERQQTKTQLEQVESERQQTKTQLQQVESECQQTKIQLQQIQKEHFQSLEKLNNLIEQFNCLVTSMVESNRWKLGNLFYSVYRKILFKPLEPSPKVHQKKLINKFQRSNLNFSNAHSNSDKYPSPENLTYVIEEFDRLVTSMIESNRWKLGNLLYTVYRKILLQPLDPSPQEHQKRLLNKFQKSNRNLTNAHSNSKKYQSVENLVNVIEGFNDLVTSMLHSNRWKLGNFFYTIFRQMLFKPLDPPPQVWQNHLRKRFQSWKEKSKKVLSAVDLNYIPYKNFSEYLRHSLLNPLINAPFREEDFRVMGVMDFRCRELAHKYQSLPQEILISIIMPTFNREHLIASAIDSVVAQSYQNWELIIVDDGGKDKTENVVKRYNDSRIYYHKLTNNVGSAEARNAALKYAKGKYFAYLDSDNFWEKDFLLIMVNYLLEAKNYHSIYCGQKVWQHPNKREKSEPELKLIRFAPFNRSLLENRNYIDLNAFVHDRFLVKKYGYFNGNMRRLVDWELILRYTSEYQPIALPCLLSHYNSGNSQNRNSDIENYQDALALVDNTLQSQNLDIPNLDPKYNFFGLMSSPRKITISRKVSIVIPSFESLEYLKLCINSIRMFTKKGMYHLVIVDNASNYQVRSYLKKLSTDPDVTVLLNDRNLGFSFAVNRGIEESDPNSDIVILNNDSIVTLGWLEALQEVIEYVDDVGIAVPRQTLLPNTKTIKQHSPSSTLEREIDVNLSVHHGNIIDPEFDPYRGFIELYFAPFFCVYIPRTTINSIGLLDVENGPHYRSDRLYCDVVRYYLKKRIIYTPFSKLYHFLQRSTDDLKNNDDQLYKEMFFRNNWDGIQSLSKGTLVKNRKGICSDTESPN